MNKELNLPQLLDNHAKETKEYVRNKRKDAGVKRESYKSILPQKYRSYISRCNKRGTEFKIGLEDFNHIISLPCAYCGKQNAGTIDRLNPREGYIEGNIAPCCVMCNCMKFTLLPDQFIKQVALIYSHSIKGNK